MLKQSHVSMCEAADGLSGVFEQLYMAAAHFLCLRRSNQWIIQHTKKKWKLYKVEKAKRRAETFRSLGTFN